MTVRGNQLTLNIEGNIYVIDPTCIVDYKKRFAAFPTVSTTELGATFYSQPSTREPLNLFEVELLLPYATGEAIYTDLIAYVQSWKQNNFRNVTLATLDDGILPEPIDGIVTKGSPTSTDPSGDWGFFNYPVVVTSYSVVHEGSQQLRIFFSAIEYLTN